MPNLSPWYGSPDGSLQSDSTGSIQALLIRTGSWVDALQVKYAANSGWSDRHGGDGGKEELLLLSEYFRATGWPTFADYSFSGIRDIVQIKGRAGSHIDQLEFTLSDGKTFTYGGSGGDPFTVDKRFESDVCLGFNYRAGDYLNAIQVVWGPKPK